MSKLFDGALVIPELDDERLTGQMYRIMNVLKDGREYTLKDIADLTGDPEASISADIRTWAKPRWGGYYIKTTRITKKGLHSYRFMGKLTDEQMHMKRLRNAAKHLGSIVKVESNFPDTFPPTVVGLAKAALRMVDAEIKRLDPDGEGKIGVDIDYLDDDDDND